MIDITADWALVLTTVGLVVATAVLAIFTWKLARETHALTTTTEGLVAAFKVRVRMEDKLRGGGFLDTAEREKLKLD